MKKLLVILGPTATGKTDLGLNLAEKFNGELVACDSRQVYRGLDSGTGKMPNLKDNWKVSKFREYWEINGIKVWMYDVIGPDLQFNAKDYIIKARQVIDKIRSRGKLPIIVGGTGLYLRGLLEGLSHLQIPANPDLRRELAGLSLGQLQQKLIFLSPERWAKINLSDRQNKRRLTRSIELITMYPYVCKDHKLEGLIKNYQILKIGLIAPREVLYKRIDLRLISRTDQGLIEEGKSLVEGGLSYGRMRELGLEYRFLADYLEGLISKKEEFISLLQTGIHQYAKRQITWFKKESDVYWYDITKESYQAEVEKQVLAWYNSSNDQKN